MMFKIHLMQDASLSVLAARIIFASANVNVEKCIFFSNLQEIFIKKKEIKAAIESMCVCSVASVMSHSLGPHGL